MTNLVTSDQNRERRQTRGVHDPDGSSSLLFSNSRLKEIDGRRSGILVDALRLGATGITFARVISGGHEVALEDPDCVTILVPTKGRLEMETGGAEYSFDRGSIVMVAAEKRRTRVIAPKDGPFVATTVLVPRYMVPALAGGGAGKPGRTTGRAAWNVQTAFARQMRQLLPDLADDLFRQEDQQFTPRARDEVIGLIKDLVSEGLGKEGPAVRPGSGISEFRRVSRACDIIRARSDEALSLTGLAAELEVSPRWLQLPSSPSKARRQGSTCSGCDLGGCGSGSSAGTRRIQSPARRWIAAFCTWAAFRRHIAAPSVSCQARQ